jgi:hypothetical protein
MSQLLTASAKPKVAPARCGSAWSSPRFWTAAVILAVAAVGMQLLPRLGVFARKEAVPLKRSLRQFDVRALGPRYERHPANDRVQPISEDAQESLGTEEYLEVYLTDTQAALADPTRVASLFVTYYTGQPDLVPHVPDECYKGSGYDVIGTSVATVHVTGVGAAHDTVPVRVARFVAPQKRRLAGGSGEVVVLYLFRVNEEFATSRDGVRMTLSNPWARYAYYSKIEVTFTDETLGRSAGADDSLAAMEPLLQALLPVLNHDYFDTERFATPPAAAGK